MLVDSIFEVVGTSWWVQLATYDAHHVVSYVATVGPWLVLFEFRLLGPGLRRSSSGLHLPRKASV